MPPTKTALFRCFGCPRGPIGLRKASKAYVGRKLVVALQGIHAGHELAGAKESRRALDQDADARFERLGLELASAHALELAALRRDLHEVVAADLGIWSRGGGAGGDL